MPSLALGLTWSLTDLRRWWMSPARIRWRRTMVYLQGSGLTNFGDVIKLTARSPVKLPPPASLVAVFSGDPRFSSAKPKSIQFMYKLVQIYNALRNICTGCIKLNLDIGA